MSETKHTPTPAKYWKRKDDSLGIAFGNPFEGYHEQFDFYGSEELAAFIVKAVNCHDELLEALKKLLRTAEEELVDADHALGVYEARVAIAKAEPTTPSTTAQEGRG